MPGLRVFGKRLNVGSDDLVIPGVIEAILNAGWLTTYGYSYLLQLEAIQCIDRPQVLNIALAGLGLTSANICLMAAVIHVSMKGTIINHHPRKMMPFLLHAKAILETLRLALLSGATYFVYSKTVQYSEAFEKLLTSAVKSGWLFLGSSFSVLGITFLYQTRKVIKAQNTEENVNLETTASPTSVTASIWRYRMKKLLELCKFESLGSSVAYDVGQLFADFFKENIDVVPSDVMAAVITLKHQQEALHAQRGPSELRHKPQAWMTVPEAAYYMKYAAGAYGWPMYIFRSPSSLFALLKVIIHSRYFPRQLPTNIIGDNCFLTNTAVIKMVTGIPEQDLIYVSYQNKLFEVPFYIALDHEKKKVLVTIRGTLSVEDVFVDIMAYTDEKLHIQGIKGSGAHAGMLRAARNVKDKIHNLDLFGQAVEKGGDKVKDYGLVICGHSLGAGVAAVLACLMYPEYPDLQCFSFSPPCGLLTLPAAKYCSKFVCAVSLGDDVITHMSVRSLHDLKLRLFKVLRDLDTPKHEVFGGWLRRLVSGIFGPSHKAVSTPDHPSWEGDAAAKEQVDDYRRHLQAAINSAEHTWTSMTDMYPPGCMMHLQEDYSEWSLFSWSDCYKYDVQWVDCDDDSFQQVVLSSDIIRHHTPWAVLHALEHLSVKHSKL